MKRLLPLFLVSLLALGAQPAQGSGGSIAKQWNEELLHAIRNSRARPTVHARNLYHWSVVAYDARAAYHPNVKPFMLGDTLHGVFIPFKGVPEPENIQKAQREAISYASYRLMLHRYKVSPKYSRIKRDLNRKMRSLGYKLNDTATTYWDGDPAHLGNYIAQQMIQYGLQDGAHEASNYSNKHYVPLNDTLNITNTGTPGLRRPNHWQPLQITKRKDQAGNPIKSTQTALSPEWGDVDPFALVDSHYVVKTRDRTGAKYKVWLDPGPPPYLDTSNPGCIKSQYKWNFCMVSVWQSHLDPADTTTWNISPGNLGNLQSYPKNFKNYDSFYNFFKGGGPGLGKGYDTNPVTGQPYQKQMVKRADYTRILAEYWADGIASETPPGHWFAIYNHVEVKPGFDNKWKGKKRLGELAYDLRSYLALGGAVHDAAVSAWSVKGWYDYVRPVSAIRNMAKQGQCTDPNKRNYDPDGIPLIKDYIEVIQPGDPLAGPNNKNVGEIKLYTWKGPDSVKNVNTDTAGVGWILAGNWWPYQKPSFVTPPFPGYVSGHSTFSQAAAKVMAKSTGSPYFPGGKSDFLFKKNEFLTHENGPTEDVVLEYATYKDAADYTALSRIWGGIHPPADDINGRIMGQKVGKYAFNKADSLFSVDPPVVDSITVSDSILSLKDLGRKLKVTVHFSEAMRKISPSVSYQKGNQVRKVITAINTQWTSSSQYQITYKVDSVPIDVRPVYLGIKDAKTKNGRKVYPFMAKNPFTINLAKPKVTRLSPSYGLVNDTLGGKVVYVSTHFNEPMDTTVNPKVKLSFNKTLIPNPGASRWTSSKDYKAGFFVSSSNEAYNLLGATVTQAQDRGGNSVSKYDTSSLLAVMTRNPKVTIANKTSSFLNLSDVGQKAFKVKLRFSDVMDTAGRPTLGLAKNYQGFKLKPAQSFWLSDSALKLVYSLQDQGEPKRVMDADFSSFTDTFGNPPQPISKKDFLTIDLKIPEVQKVEASTPYIGIDEQGLNNYYVLVTYNEAMNTNEKPVLKFKGKHAGKVEYDLFGSQWQNNQVFKAFFNVSDTAIQRPNLSLEVNFAEDGSQNKQAKATFQDFTVLDTKPPKVTSIQSSSQDSVANSDTFRVTASFNEGMDTATNPQYQFESAEANLSLPFTTLNATWQAKDKHTGSYVLDSTLQSSTRLLAVVKGQATDVAGNELDTAYSEALLVIRPTGKRRVKDRKKHVKVYPNLLDRNGLLKIRNKTGHRITRLTLKNTAGQVVKQLGNQALPSHSEQSFRLNVSKGLYLIGFRVNDEYTTRKIIVK